MVGGRPASGSLACRVAGDDVRFVLQRLDGGGPRVDARDVGHEVVQVFTTAFATVFYVGAGLFVVGLVCALLLKNVKLASHGQAVQAALAE